MPARLAQQEDENIQRPPLIRSSPPKADRTTFFPRRGRRPAVIHSPRPALAGRGCPSADGRVRGRLGSSVNLGSYPKLFSWENCRYQRPPALGRVAGDSLPRHTVLHSGKSEGTGKRFHLSTSSFARGTLRYVTLHPGHPPVHFYMELRGLRGPEYQRENTRSPGSLSEIYLMERASRSQPLL